MCSQGLSPELILLLSKIVGMFGGTALGGCSVLQTLPAADLCGSAHKLWVVTLANFYGLFGALICTVMHSYFQQGSMLLHGMCLLTSSWFACWWPEVGNIFACNLRKLPWRQPR